MRASRSIWRRARWWTRNDVTPAAASTTAPPPYPERRQLTLLRCGLRGPALLAARRNPEDLQQLLVAFHTSCTATIQRAGGIVAKRLGETVLAYFGYPETHEDAAERAIRAALRLIATTSEIAVGQAGALQARAGIATGLVLVGDLLGAGSGEPAVLGEAPDLAARLLASTEPGTVLIGPATRRLVGETFRYRGHAPVTLDGLADPLPAWEVIGEGVASRFEALRGYDVADLVSREDELFLLLRRWEQAGAGAGRVVLIIGEPGIGKSRLVRAMQERVAGEGPVLRYFCSPHHRDSALHPVIAQLEAEAAFTRDDTAEARFAKLRAMLARSDASGEAIALLASLLSIPAGELYRLPEMSPQKFRESTLGALLGLLAGLVARAPGLVIFEDVHWIDPTTLELLARTVEQLAFVRVLLLVTARPEFKPPWPDQAHVTTLVLNRLRDEESGALVRQTASGVPLPGVALQQIVEHAEGVPLFVEELTKAVLESGALAEGDGSTPLSIPTSLRDLLLARLDRLGPAREVAQIGAVIGREFSGDLLALVADMPDPRLREALDRLTKSGLVFTRGIPPRSSYMFKHILVRDAAYSTLPRGRRQALHASIAKALEEQSPDTIETEPELLAQHYAAAGLIEQALAYWLRAGQRAARRSANQEAIRFLMKGTEQLKRIPDSIERARRELSFQTALGPALLATKGWAAAEAGDSYIRARELCEQVGDTAQLFATLWGTWLFRWARGEITPALDLVNELLALATQHPNEVLQLQAHHAGWTTFTYLGELQTALFHAERGAAIYRPERHGSLALAYGGHDPGVCAGAHASQPLWLRGYPDKALMSSNQSLALARQLSHAPSLVHALFHAVWLDQFRRDPVAAGKRAEALARLATDQGQFMYVAVSSVFLGWVVTACGEAETGLCRMREGIANFRSTGARNWIPFYAAMLADALWRAGDDEEAFVVLREAREAAKSASDRFFWEAEMVRLEGELLLACRAMRESEAEELFRRAITISGERQAKSLELRAAMSLGRLWRSQGRHAEAHGLLEPIYVWFTEGFDTPDLIEAKALLGDLERA